MGYAGNVEPSFIVPTVVALNENFSSIHSGQGGRSSATAAALHSAGVMADLDFFIGEEALAAARRGSYVINSPIKHGQVVGYQLGHPPPNAA